MFSIDEYAEMCHLPLTSVKELQFSLTYTEIPWLVKLSLTAKKINFPGMVTNVTRQYCEEIRNTDVFFELY